ncbi:alpha/beta fold hydrolase [Rhodanobacter lindaniclasticus]|uniref:AB hydrolase-1 domain-containing protein n=1 Tax=Rhodanobacter lindaniclasticus TaxID=75310 RepID=A0A4S3K8G8_9GAMM|nr:alpha/beta hydrolase [Rhodanobacter lindaniclasticus]THD04540.1 hypothetical protein B1991_17305 [Rhodanobacter lindaniclasticus]
MKRTALPNVILALAVLMAPLGAHATGPVTAPPPPRWATLPDVPPLPRPDVDDYVSVNGARLHYMVFNAGGGRPVLLLHGGLGSALEWGFEVPRLTPRHEVIALDCRGRGRSSLPAQPLGYALMAADTIGVLDALHLPTVSIVGESDGGIIGLLLAIYYPERVHKLFVFGANYSRSGYTDTPPDPRLAARYMARVQADYRRLSPTPDGFIRMRAMLGDMYSREPEIAPADLARITAPTVVADGDHEQFIRAAHTRSLARLIPGARLEILADVGHGGVVQDPQAFHSAVASLLDP